MRYAVLALLLYVSVTRGADPGTSGSVAPALSAKTFQTDEAAADSLWAYRNRFARSASHMTQRLKSMTPASATAGSKEYSYLEKVNDALLQASLLLTWSSDIMRMQQEMCEPGRSRYDGVVVDRLQRTRDTLTTLPSLLAANSQTSDQETKREILARNDDVRAARQALDSILERREPVTSDD